MLISLHTTITICCYEMILSLLKITEQLLTLKKAIYQPTSPSF